jgi:hypothetical protein
VGELKDHYKMDAWWGTNQFADATPNNNYATASGGVTNVTGKIGNAMQFDGTSGYATIPGPQLHGVITGQSGVSISAWIKNDGPKPGCSGGNCQQNIYFGYATGSNGASTSKGGFGLRISENYELMCGGRSNINDAYNDLKIPYAWQGQWIHAVCVIDALNKKITAYVNGKEVGNMAANFSATTMVNSNNTINDFIGAGYTPGTTSPVTYFYRGTIDQLKLYNKVLSTSEITTLYQEGGGTSCTPATTCGTGKVCGTVPDGCGGLVNCGTCSAGQTCTSSNTCTSSCTAKTCSNAGIGGAAVACGQPSNGCGGTLSCGNCAAGQQCNASFQCVTACTPTTCSAAGKNCGNMSDGCSVTLNCGTCSSGNVCTNNVCVAGSGGACAGLQEWDPNMNWTDYAGAAPYTQKKHNNRKYECRTKAWCFYEPGGPNSSLGWVDLGGC